MKVLKNEEEWKKKLTPEQFKILRQKGTETAFSGKYLNLHDDGLFHCVGCENKLFKSSTKFDSGSGWPSFWDVAEKGNVIIKKDNSFGIKRSEVLCASCEGHLGHVFDDGPRDKSGLRYCINSCALKFNKKEKNPSGFEKR